MRSIPTCVGLTTGEFSVRHPESVHPHVRGAHRDRDHWARLEHGPSPRAWGSQRVVQRSVERPRSIPTCVGLTPPSVVVVRALKVHPHVRGAHGHLPLGVVVGGGPSPRAWGSPPSAAYVTPGWRSIPTCVGLTAYAHVARDLSTVHPHVRGAHHKEAFRCSLSGGPSPRAWGSPDGAGFRGFRTRSIPTCVGLTPVVVVDAPHVGPSPRAWGSQISAYTRGLKQRSIPTCVGLTGRRRRWPTGRPVHPHVRGAHHTTAVVTVEHVGPSPRAWGSRLGAGCL